MLKRPTHPSNILIVCFIFIFSIHATAQCPCSGYNNTTAQDGNWQAGATWNSNPTPDCNVTEILLVQNTVTANCGMDVQGSACLQVDSGDTLIIDADAGLTGNGDICIEGTLIVKGNLDISGSGTLQLDGNLQVDDTVTVSGSGSISGDGNANVGSGCADFPDSIDCNNTLPVELISFNARVKNEKVEVTWVTQTEQNCDRFIVERSADGQHFDQVALVKGAGHSEIRQTYQTIDNDPYLGTSYYRLKQIDFDGYQTVYKTKAVEINRFYDINITPNPVARDRTILVNVQPLATNKPVTITIYNSTGQKVYHKPLTVENRSLNTTIHMDEALPAGIYFIRGYTEATPVLREKLFVQ